MREFQFMNFSFFTAICLHLIYNSSNYWLKFPIHSFCLDLICTYLPKNFSLDFYFSFYYNNIEII